MAQPQYSPINMNGLEILNMRFQNLGSAPGGNIGPGSVYFDTGMQRLMWRVATTWTNPLDRASHEGTQSADTIGDLAAVVQAYALNAFAAPTGNLSLGGQKAVDVALGTAPTDAANVTNVTGAITALRLNHIAADGDVALGSNKLLGVGLGTAPTDGASVQNVTNAIGSLRLNTLGADADVDFGGFRAVNLAPGTNANHAATFGQLQDLQNGTHWRPAVRVATTGNVPLTGLQTIDGVTVAAGERVLVRANDNAVENGIWIAASGAWARAADVLRDATAVMVQEGTLWSKSQHRITTDGPIDVGTTPITWDQFGAGTAYTNGTGLKLVGNVFAIDATVARRAAADVGDGVATAVVVTHGLGTYDVAVSVYDAVTREDVGCDITRTSLNAVTLGFAVAPAPGAFRCVVTG